MIPAKLAVGTLRFGPSAKITDGRDDQCLEHRTRGVDGANGVVVITGESERDADRVMHHPRAEHRAVQDRADGERRRVGERRRS